MSSTIYKTEIQTVAGIGADQVERYLPSLPIETILPAERPQQRAEIAVILATTSRVAHDEKPESTISLLGLSIGNRVILACKEAGIRRFVVVLGDQKERVRAHFDQIAAKYNCNLTFVDAGQGRYGSGASVLATVEEIGDAPFLLLPANHLVEPQLIRAVLSTTGVRQGEVVVAVDHNCNGIFDGDHASKVKLNDGRLRQTNKRLGVFDAADASVLLGTKALFEALEDAEASGRYRLSDGLNLLFERGAARTVDVTGLLWFDVNTPEALREARHRLIADMSGKGEDGFVSRRFNRPISRRISTWLAATHLTPNQITVVSFGLSLIGAALLAVGGGALTIAGGLVVQAASIIDGCDGEIARLKYLASRRGAWLDTMLDRYADTAVVLGITFAHAQAHPGPWVWLSGMVALAGFILAGYSTKEYAIRHDKSYPNDVLNRLKRRDLRLFGIAVGAVCGQPYFAMLALGFLNHVCVFGIMVRGWSLSVSEKTG
jgi:CDP-L-myo-inositol myo-inositolphosphotransferase